MTFEALAQDGARLGLPPASVEKIEAVREAGLASLSILHEAGVPMAYGTDLLGETHARQNEEFALRARALPAIDILRAATTIAARLLRMEGQIGTLAPGAHADLIVVDGKPGRRRHPPRPARPRHPPGDEWRGDPPVEPGLTPLASGDRRR